MLSEKFYLTTLLLMSTCSTIIYNRPTAIIKSDRPLPTVKRTTGKGSQRVNTGKSSNKKARTTKTKTRKKKSSCNESTKKRLTNTTTRNPKNNPVNRTITVKNNITNNMLTYKHWSGTHEPSFRLTVNGEKIGQGKQKKIPVKNNILKVKYDYSFANGIRKGVKVVSCNIAKDAKDVGISFSWHSKWHIKTDHAQPQKIESVTF